MDARRFDRHALVPQSTHDRGYAKTLMQAMADFKAAWERVADQLVTPPKGKTAG
jgi:hypothetical protein